MYPHILSDPEGQLYEGASENVTKAFARSLKKIVDLHTAEIKKDYNVDPLEIGIHSYRKQAHNSLNCGTTVGPERVEYSVSYLREKKYLAKIDRTH